MKSIWNQPLNPNFNLEINNGIYTSLNQESFYAKKFPDSNFTIDVGNQKCLANLDEFGTVKELTFYQNNYRTEEKPGVWVNKNFVQTKNLIPKFLINGKMLNWNNAKHKIQWDLIEDVIPRYQHTFSQMRIRMLIFAPIYKNERISELIYVVQFENLSSNDLNIQLQLPTLYKNKYSDQANVDIFSNSPTNKNILLKAQQTKIFTFGYFNPDDINAYKIYQNNSWIQLLKSTINFFQQMWGNLELSDDQVTRMFHRAIIQAFNAQSINNKDEFVGGNWGSFPVTKRIWNKDLYYSSLVNILFDASIAKKSIIWFTKYSVKQPGSKFKGGVLHSLSNTLTPILLAGMYFNYSGDLSFFKSNSEIIQNAVNIIEEIIKTRKNDEPYLFKSIWLSDAYSLGKYHVGSNICMWLALKGLSQILCSLGWNKKSLEYSKLAENVQKDLFKYATINKGTKSQFLEGYSGNPHDPSHLCDKKYKKDILDQGLIFLTDVIENDQINLMMHDGEESDTTLMSFYHFTNNEDPTYQQTMDFAASNKNPTYSSQLQAIKWGDESGATFPGFMTIWASKLNNPIDGKEYLEELKKLLDIDGSWWWWPYKKHASYGDVVRNFGCGKCGWASGLFVVLFISRYLGISKIDNAVQLDLDSMNISYCWEKLRLGSSYLNINFNGQTLVINNLNNKKLKIVIIKNNVKQHIVIESKKNFKYKK
ncbi:MAG: glycoside hydrolase [Lactobacillus sp.]|uniref:glycoside hydrolase n=1 Tax=Bombilactobacillus bombi TaxID=1303590 RepID=UPI0035E4DDC7|nr:glycoside hydrolase [Lactobacillus sp.]